MSQSVINSSYDEFQTEAVLTWTGLLLGSLGLGALIVWSLNNQHVLLPKPAPVPATADAVQGEPVAQLSQLPKRSQSTAIERTATIKTPISVSDADNRAAIEAVDPAAVQAELANIELAQVELVEPSASQNAALELSVAQAEAERVELARVEAARVEAERVEAERVEAERVEAERVEAERVEAERVEAERKELSTLEVARAKTLRLKAQAEAEAVKAEAIRLESLKIEAEKASAARIEIAQLEATRIETARAQAEGARVSNVRVKAEAARLEAERQAAEAARKPETAFEKLRREELSALVKLSSAIQLDPESDEINEAAMSSLYEAFELLFLYSETPVVVEVQSNDTSSELRNVNLAQERGDVIVNYLVQNGLDRERFTIKAGSSADLALGNHQIAIQAKLNQ